MFPVIDIGPVAVQAAGLVLLLSLWIGIWLTGKLAANLGTNGDAIETGILYGLLAGILGARLGFLIQNPSIFADNPLSLVSLTPAMLDGSFGLLTAALTLVILFQKKHLPLWPTLDTLSPLVIMIFAGIHIADYANGNNFGLPTTLPWGVYLWNAVRHPVQLYILLLGLVLFLWLLLQTRVLRRTGFIRSGILFSATLAGLAFITLITRAFVAEKLSFLGADLIQVIAFFILGFCLYLIYHKAFKDRKHIVVYLSLGSNRNPEENLIRAVELIAEDFKIRTRSNLYRTVDVRENAGKNQYFNQVLEIEVDMPYIDLLSWSKDLESRFDREPGDKDNVPLDVDIIVYNGDVFSAGGKTIPDPNLSRFSYIAFPLAEITPEFRHPATGQSIQDILTALEKSGQPIEKLTEVENGTQR
ncbi:MAG TPA: 2-amino-4-hydroxy-6-hydroxymethyldihydropteridine diphosphokinase [Anaerolineaceae bacterium]|nr:2-amino-4-hydroxy-6-hydroxymethyldihydropteridine diphosphokinase [Anaerolineaceae bacterium]